MHAAPQAVGNRSHRADFDRVDPSVKDWLKRHAANIQTHESSKARAECKGDTVIGYHCLTSGAIGRREVLSARTRNMKPGIFETARGATSQDNINSSEIRSIRIPLSALDMQVHFEARSRHALALRLRQIIRASKSEAAVPARLARSFLAMGRRQAAAGYSQDETTG